MQSFKLIIIGSYSLTMWYMIRCGNCRYNLVPSTSRSTAVHHPSCNLMPKIRLFSRLKLFECCSWFRINVGLISNKVKPGCFVAVSHCGNIKEWLGSNGIAIKLMLISFFFSCHRLLNLKDVTLKSISLLRLDHLQ